MRLPLLASTAAVTAALALPAFAQTDQPPVAEQCMADLAAFNDEATGAMREQGIAIGGASREQVRRLTDAAQVFALNGNEDACQMVLAEIRNTFTMQRDAFMAENPDIEAFRTTRTERLAMAVDVEERAGMLRADDLIGADVRSMQDEDLGDIEDVILDPSEGGVAFVLLARGGFLGMGQDYVPVRWGDLKVTEDGDTYVVNMTEEQFDSAPTINIDTLENDAEWRTGVESWWDENMAG